MEKINKLSGIIVVLFFMHFFASCTGKAPMNGNLDGNWQMLKYVDVNTGKETLCNRLYWAVQLWVVELNDRGGNGYNNFIGRFTYDKEQNKVYMKDFRFRYNEDEKATEEDLLPYAIDSTDATFDVVKADGKNLVLQSDSFIIYFRSF